MFLRATLSRENRLTALTLFSRMFTSKVFFIPLRPGSLSPDSRSSASPSCSEAERVEAEEDHGIQGQSLRGIAVFCAGRGTLPECVL